MEYNTLAAPESLDRTIAALSEHHFLPIQVQTKEEALEKIKELITPGASVMNGASRTLAEIGFTEYLKAGEHGWNNLHANIVAETDPEKQATLRRESVTSDFYLGSAHAVTETGELYFASNSGSQLPHLAYTSKNIILVVGTQKIVPSLQVAVERLNSHIIPLEDVRMKEVYGYGTGHFKTLILHGENPAMGRSVHVIFVNEILGF